MKKILIILGSKSDLDKFEKAREMLRDFGASYDIHIASAHRTPEKAVNLVKDAIAQGYGVIIAAAGMSAHLPGVLAAHTTLPVIGVPMESGGLGGLDALLSISQMPEGIPVATMSIGKAGAVNAALYALSILSLADDVLMGKLQQYRKKLAEKVEEADRELQGEAHAG